MASSAIPAIDVCIFVSQHLQGHHTDSSYSVAGCFAGYYRAAARIDSKSRALYQLRHSLLATDSRSDGGAPLHGIDAMRILRVSRRRTSNSGGRTNTFAI